MSLGREPLQSLAPAAAEFAWEARRFICAGRRSKKN